ncbi:hypothetical protein CsNV_064 [Callinectes sapidus nudivirus]|nr:hypothetical protein CsNV_064 [Callinectes sapidus nudivirus]
MGYKNIETLYPHVGKGFTNYLSKKLEEFKSYSKSNATFESMKVEDCIKSANTHLPKSNKVTTLKHSKLFDNDRVILTPTKMSVRCDKCSESSIHTINTGIIFRIPDNQILVISMATSEGDKIRMNPVVIDSTNTMPVILFLNTDAIDETTFDLDLTLFATNVNKFNVNNKRINANKGIIKNFKALPLEAFNIILLPKDENSKMTKISVSETIIQISTNSALFIFPRKRYHLRCQHPMYGVVQGKNQNAEVFNSEVDPLMDNFSFVVVNGVYTNVQLVLTNEPIYSINGGYNGWFSIIDPKYNEIVALFKDGAKIINSIQEIKMILEKNCWFSQENLEKVESALGKKGVNAMKRNSNIDTQDFEEYLNSIKNNVKDESTLFDQKFMLSASLSNITSNQYLENENFDNGKNENEENANTEIAKTSEIEKEEIQKDEKSEEPAKKKLKTI